MIHLNINDLISIGLGYNLIWIMRLFLLRDNAIDYISDSGGILSCFESFAKGAGKSRTWTSICYMLKIYYLEFKFSNHNIYHLSSYGIFSSFPSIYTDEGKNYYKNFNKIINFTKGILPPLCL